MVTVKELKGIAVIDVDGGKKLGTADEFVFSPEDQTLLGVVVRTGGLIDRSERVVETAGVRALGRDAITVHGEDAARDEDGASEAFRSARTGERTLLGSKVVTPDGSLLGRVDDIYLDEVTKKVTAIAVRTDVLHSATAIAVERIQSVGPDVVVVSNGRDP